MALGRPSSYRPEFAAQAHKLARLAATDLNVADFFGVNVATIYRWKLDFPDFREALKLGKDEMDSAVEQSLYRRAMGYTSDATKIMQHDGQPVEVPYVEHHAPDTTAMIFWLKNRQPKRWRDKQELEHTGQIEFADRLVKARARKTKTVD